MCTTEKFLGSSNFSVQSELAVIFIAHYENWAVSLRQKKFSTVTPEVGNEMCCCPGLVATAHYTNIVKKFVQKKYSVSNECYIISNNTHS